MSKLTSSGLRTQLAGLTNSSGVHKELADRYRSLLDQVLTCDESSESLKIFIEASMFTSLFHNKRTLTKLFFSCKRASQLGDISPNPH